MNNVQKHLIKLLQEIDEICKANNIQYVLCGRTAKDACKDHHFRGDYVYASVLVHAKDFPKLRKIVAGMEGRTTESILDYPDFPDGRAMRYVDETTTFAYGHTAHLYRHHGIYITIQQARSVVTDKRKVKLIKGLDKVISGIANKNEPKPVKMSRKKKLALQLIKLFTAMIGDSAAIRLFIGMQNMLMKKDAKKLAYIRKGKDDINLDSKMLLETKRVVFEGVQLNVPKSEDTFIQQVFGKSWKTDEKEEKISSAHLLTAAVEVPYSEVGMQEILGMGRAEVQKMINERSAISASISSMRKSIEKYWDVLFLTRERYRLYALYKPVESILCEKLEQGEVAWMLKVMKDYLDNVKLYAGKGYPLQVSPTMDSLALEMLKRSKDDASAKKFAQLIATVTLKPVSVKITDHLVQQAKENLAQYDPPELPVGENNVA